MKDHYIALMPAYGTVALLWFLIHRKFRKPWDEEIEIQFSKPWLELIFAFLAIVFILILGQIYQNDMLVSNKNNQFIDSINQFIIFSPTVALLLIRKQSLQTIWLPKSNIPIRLLVGLCLAFFALLVYWIIRKDASDFSSILINTYNPKNISHFVQVFMEDITIALLFVRLIAWIGRKWSIVIVSFLFAAGHIPALISNGFVINEISGLLIDVAIGVIIFAALSKSKDIWWFFVVHFTLDMTQFYGGS